MFEKSTSARTAAILANVSGTHLCLIEVGGSFGRELSANGEAAMVNFAADWLTELYGNDVKKAIKRSQATRWNHEPRTLGAFSAAAPGGQGARRILMGRCRIQCGSPAKPRTKPYGVPLAARGSPASAWPTRSCAGLAAARRRPQRKQAERLRARRNACASHRAINDNPWLYAAGHHGSSG